MTYDPYGELQAKNESDDAQDALKSEFGPTPRSQFWRDREDEDEDDGDSEEPQKVAIPESFSTAFARYLEITEAEIAWHADEVNKMRAERDKALARVKELETRLKCHTK